MSALPARVGGAGRPAAGAHAAAEWAQIEQAAPALAVTMRRYLAQAATFLAPRSVAAADGALRQLARWILASTNIESVTQIRRDEIEEFKVWLSAQQGTNGSLSTNTYGQRLRMLRVFFERIIEWDWADAPPPQPRHRRGHPAPPGPAAQVPGRSRRGPADGSRPGLRRSPRPPSYRAARPHWHAGR